LAALAARPRTADEGRNRAPVIEPVAMDCGKETDILFIRPGARFLTSAVIFRRRRRRKRILTHISDLTKAVNWCNIVDVSFEEETRRPEINHAVDVIRDNLLKDVSIGR
jgi:hypothetical protein